MGEQGLADPERLAIMVSAGGYTTLEALTTTRVFAAGISLFGVADLETLARDTHKFESRYLDGLVGPYPERREVYVESAPRSTTSTISPRRSSCCRAATTRWSPRTRLKRWRPPRGPRDSR